MKRLKFQFGLTLVEMLIVVGIVAVLASIALRLATRIEGQGKERLTRATISILNAALEQFADYDYRYPNEAYRVFDFPVDCTEYPDPCGVRPNIFQPTIEDVMSEPQSNRVAGAALVSPAFHRAEYSGCEAMWFFLDQVPDCRQTLDKIDKSLVRAVDANNVPLFMEIRLPTPAGTDSVRNYPLTRVVDAWGTTLHYDYYDEFALNSLFPADPANTLWVQAMNWVVGSKKTFPVITSAGPDRLFGTSDDIQVERKP